MSGTDLATTRRRGCLALAAGLVVLAAAGALFLRARIDPSALTETLLPGLARQAGFELALEDVSRVGLRGLTVAGVSAAGPIGEGCVTVQASELRVDWQLRPWLSGRVVVDQIAVEGPEIAWTLACGTGGSAASGQGTSSPTAAAQPTEPTAEPTSLRLEVQEIALRDGSLRVIDTETSATPTLEMGRLDLELREITFDGALSARGTTEGSALVLADMAADTVTADFSLEGGTFELHQLELALPQGGVTSSGVFALDAVPLTYELDAEVALDVDRLLSEDPAPPQRMGTSQVLLDGRGEGTEPSGFTAAGTVAVPAGRLGGALTGTLAAVTGIPELQDLAYPATNSAFRIENSRFELEEPLLFRAQDTTGELTGVALTVRGGADLPAEGEPLADLRIAAQVPRDRLDIDELREVLDILTDDEGLVELPLEVTGPLSAPRTSIDERALTRAAGRGVGREVTRRLFRKLDDLLNDNQ